MERTMEKEETIQKLQKESLQSLSDKDLLFLRQCDGMARMSFRR
jgi:hypothetical protein